MQQQNLNITLDKTTSMACDECGKETFREVYMLRKASRFVTGTPQDALIPIPVFACAECGHVNNEFLPQQLRDQDESAEII
jgi:uncharacterized Zn finger protein